MLGYPWNPHQWCNSVINITYRQIRDSRLSPIAEAEWWSISLAQSKDQNTSINDGKRFKTRFLFPRYCTALLSWVSFNASPSAHINHGSVQQHKLVLCGWQWFIRIPAGCARLPHHHNSFNSPNRDSFSFLTIAIRALNFSHLFVYSLNKTVTERWYEVCFF